MSEELDGRLKRRTRVLCGLVLTSTVEGLRLEWRVLLLRRREIERMKKR